MQWSKITETMSDRERNDKGRFAEEYPDSSILDAIETLGGAAGTQEVADEVGCPYRTAYHKLSKLEERGQVSSRKVANARLWSRADE